MPLTKFSAVPPRLKASRVRLPPALVSRLLLPLLVPLKVMPLAPFSPRPLTLISPLAELSEMLFEPLRMNTPLASLPPSVRPLRLMSPLLLAMVIELPLLDG